MRKKNITRKLIMSISTAAMTAICLGTTTYAWFSRNDIVWTEETDFNLDFYSGLLISLDGTNYQQAVSKEDLYKAVTQIDDAEQAEEAFKNIKLDGVTPVHDSLGKLSYTDNYVDFIYDTVDEDTKEHGSQPAEKNKKFIQFDLWFRIADGGTVQSLNVPKYNLVFTDRTSVISKAGAQQIQLVNSLTTVDKEYSAGETIEVDGVNSLRTGIQKYNNDGTTSMIVYEPVNEYNLGSAAIEGRTDDLHNPSKNAMYTYYNNFFSEKFTKAADDGEAFDTHSRFNDGTSLGLFEGVVDTDLNGNKYYKYNDVKLTLYLWLEGWDADYFYGITSSNELGRTMKSFFEFTYVEV